VITIIQAPCKGCPDRYLGCYDKCSKFNTYKLESNNIKQMKLREDIFINYMGQQSKINDKNKFEKSKFHRPSGCQS
jgi:hypothetical protein